MRGVRFCAVLLMLLGNGCQKSPPADDSSKQGADAPRTPSNSVDQTQDEPDAKFEFVRPRLSREEIEAGWISLFDGKTLFGWQPDKAGADWEVVDGAIRSQSQQPGLLLTPFRMSDFELRCEFRLEAGGNSGLFLRTVAQPSDPTVDCYELNICDTHETFPTGSLVGREKPAMTVASEGDWHSYHVRLEGNRIQVQFDDQMILDVDEPAGQVCESGLLGLQANGGQVEFRQIYLRPLNTQPLMNGKDLAGWSVVPGASGTFELDSGEIHAAGGPAYLQSDREFANFILQFDVRVEGDGLNSGVFFRAEPGTADAPANGYELQICNQFADGDRSRPNEYGTGFGTGAIFRRQKARWIVSDDRKWMSLALVADGPRFMTWVDGYPVTVWSDDRKPNRNPRRGLRLQPGRLSLQGHDPTTNIRFRNFRIQELPNE